MRNKSNDNSTGDNPDSELWLPPKNDAEWAEVDSKAGGDQSTTAEISQQTTTGTYFRLLVGWRLSLILDWLVRQFRR